MKTPLAFMHIPKSAGTALTNALLRLEPYQNEIHGWDRSLLGAYDEFDTWDQGRRPWLFLSPDEITEGKNFISGHIGYSSIKKRYSDAYIFTIIRNPFSRLLSLWTFWRAKPNGLESDIGTYAAHVYSARQPLKSFLTNKSIAPQIDNVTARMLLWPHPLIPNDKFIDSECTNEIIDQSLSILSEFNFVDIYENSKWLENFQKWLGISFGINKENETDFVPKPYQSCLKSEMTSETLNIIEERTRIDKIIWQKIGYKNLGFTDMQKLTLSIELDSMRKFNEILSGS